MNRVAYFGGTFDPVHNGHLNIARAIVPWFELDRLNFLPAFHAPHKSDRSPTSSYHRFAMLAIATEEDDQIGVSTLELAKREKRYTIDTLDELHSLHPTSELFFIMGADSWGDIRTWRDWENVLLSSNHIIVTRPGYPISSDHVTDRVRERIIDVRQVESSIPVFTGDKRIYFTDAVDYDTSATELRDDLSDGRLDREDDIPAAVAKYIEKYELYR